LLHLIPHLEIDQWLLSGTAAAERSVERDHAVDGVASARQITFLLIEQGLLRIEGALEIRKPFAVLAVREVQRAICRDGCFAQDPFAFECLDQVRRGIVGLACRLPHAVPVRLDELL
jgi:hypothetical protein